jgi:hypothetical protein
MPDQPNVVVILARCKKTKKLFGIRLEEEHTSRWFADWAFSIQENKARKEGYAQNTIQGSFDIDPAYPGCPHCQAPGFFQCSCGKIGSYDGESRQVICPWCGRKIELSGLITSIQSNQDR